MPVDANPDVAALGKNSEAAGLAADVQPANYLNLSVRVNRQPLAIAGHGRARFNGKDVTRQQIGSAHVLTPVPNAQLVCRLVLETTNKPHRHDATSQSRTNKPSTITKHKTQNITACIQN